MALPVKDQMKYWGIATGVSFVLLWVLGDVILPFVLGAAIAYCLDPIADRLEKVGFSRAMATTTITLIAGIVFVLAALLVVPLLVQQLAGLVETAPQLFYDLKGFLTERFPSLLDENSRIYQSLVTIGDKIQSKGGDILNGVLASAAGLVNVVVLIVVVYVL